MPVQFEPMTADRTPLRAFGFLVLAALLAILFTACEARNIRPEDGPRLISEVTIAPLTAIPTREASPSPTLPPSQTPTEELTEESVQDPLLEPTERPRVMTFTPSDSFDRVTPTLPPSKTPTVTPSVTPTQAPTFTQAPTVQQVAQNLVLVPTMVFITPPPPQQAIAIAPNPTAVSPQGDVSLPLPGVPDIPAASCSQTRWFFTNPPLPECPPNDPVTGPGAYQNFQYGAMIWVGSQDAIYVVYDDDQMPRWQVFQDTFEEGMPEKDPALDSQTDAYADFQPRRGFGLIWRENNLLPRLGWAESDYEQQYTVNVQTRADGTIFISEPDGRVYGLATSGDWRLYR